MLPTYVAQNATSTTIITAFIQDTTIATLAGAVLVIGLAVIFLAIGFAWGRLRRKAVGAKKF